MLEQFMNGTNKMVAVNQYDSQNSNLLRGEHLDEV